MGEIKQIVESTRFYKEGGSCFECCDYEGMIQDLYEKVEQFRERTYKEQKKKIIEEVLNELSKYGISAPDTKALVLNVSQFEAVLKNKLKQIWEKGK
jgi:chaperonin cofactor prefoldin